MNKKHKDINVTDKELMSIFDKHIKVSGTKLCWLWTGPQFRDLPGLGKKLKSSHRVSRIVWNYKSRCAKVQMIGVGGAGNNAGSRVFSRLESSGIEDIEIVIVNTDAFFTT